MSTQNYESFEAVRERLDEIVEAVNAEGTTLDEALALYEEAVKLGLAACDLSEEGALDLLEQEAAEQASGVEVEEASAAEQEQPAQAEQEQPAQAEQEQPANSAARSDNHIEPDVQ